MHKLVRRIFLVFCAFTPFVFTISLAQNNSSPHNISIEIPEVALLDLESNLNSSISVNPVSPTEAGNSLDFSTAFNNEIWINYSSVTATSNEDRNLSAYIEGEIPDGLVLNVTVSPYSGNGAGKTGISVGKITLTEQVQKIITNIGSCYTGDGVNNGHLLTYSLELKNGNSYSDLKYDESTTISVNYILLDDN